MAQLLTLFRHAAATPVGDAELLDRFSAGRDEAAFAELVRRYGPVVLRVCRRLVGPDAAEDAFQATFLVLATRLDAARAVASVGGWLVGVAGRVARQMRRAAVRRSRHETAAAVSRSPSESAAPELGDQFTILDEEIARLPARLRDPVVLCLLQGRTQEQAAAELGRDARTLRRRLGRAKQVLRARLERRGVVPVVAAALVSGAGVAVAVPRILADRTTATVFDFLTGGAGAARSVPVVLAKGVAMTTFPRKVLQVMAVALAGLLGVGGLLASDEKPRPTTKVELAPPPKTAGEPPTIQIEGVLVKVPAEFCERCGLDGGQPRMSSVDALSRREVKMLTELIRLDKTCEVQSSPKVIVTDNQTGYIQVGQDFPYVASSDVKDGVPVQKIEYRPVGVTTRMTPRVSADGRTILLRAELQHSTVTPDAINLGNGLQSPAFNIQTLQTTADVPDGGTMVIRFGTTKAANGKVVEHLWMLTPTVVRTKDVPAVVPPKAAVPVQVVAPPVMFTVPTPPTVVVPQPLPMAKPTPVKP